MKNKIAWITLGIGILFSLIILKLSPLAGESAIIALLPSLFVTELGLISTLYGSYTSMQMLKQHENKITAIASLIGNLLLALGFLFFGLQLWQPLTTS